MNKKSRLVGVLIGVLAGLAHADKPVYVAGNFNGHGYELIPTPTPWHLAKKKAEEKDGYLVVITSEKENEFITELVRKSTNGELCEVWIGLEDEKSEGDWRWINGEKYIYNNWDKSNPSNSDGAENAVQLIKTDEKLQWNDRSSDRRCAYIIEYDHEMDFNGRASSGKTKSNLRSTR